MNKEKKNMKKYYVEIVENVSSDEVVYLQSKSYTNKKSALRWFENSINFLTLSLTAFLVCFENQVLSKEEIF